MDLTERLIMTDQQFGSNGGQQGDYYQKYSIDGGNTTSANNNSEGGFANNGSAAQGAGFSASTTAQMPTSQTQYQTTTQASPSPNYSQAYSGNANSGTASWGQASYASGGSAIPAAAPAKKNGGAKTFATAFAGALIACVLAFGVASATGLFGTNVTLGSSSSSTISADDVDASLATQVADKCLPSVVSINVYTEETSTNSIYDYLYGNSNSNSSSLTLSSRGSGVVLSSDGYILTNYHVVSGGKKFEAVIDGSTLEATLVGSDSSSDVAVLKVEGSGYTAIEIGDSDNITVGEWVMSIGSPFGLEQSVATGIVSATSRSQIIDESTAASSGIDTALIYPNLIQTDAAINPGNSGGALVDANGKLIGINTLITSYSGNYSGVGFAIPSNYAINLAQEIIEGKTPTHAQLGVNLSTVSSEAAARYGFKVSSGAYVSNVLSGSGAAKAGLEVGDIITGFDGTSITSASDLLLAVRTKNPGDTASVTYNRDGQDITVDVVLGSDETTSTSTSTESNNYYRTQSEDLDAA
jgi:putative serine protease PepD